MAIGNIAELKKKKAETIASVIDVNKPISKEDLLKANKVVAKECNESDDLFTQADLNYIITDRFELKAINNNRFDVYDNVTRTTDSVRDVDLRHGLLIGLEIKGVSLDGALNLVFDNELTNGQKIETTPVDIKLNGANCFLDIQKVNDVDKLYSCLTKEQGNILRQYYFWYARRMFLKNVDADRSFTDFVRAKEHTQKKLKNTNLSDWDYAGFAIFGSDFAWTPQKKVRQKDGTIVIKEGHWDRVYLGHSEINNSGCMMAHFAAKTTKVNLDKIFTGTNESANFTMDIDSITDARNPQSENYISMGLQGTSEFFQVDASLIKVLASINKTVVDEMTSLYNIYQPNESFKVSDEGVFINSSYNTVAYEIPAHLQQEFKLFYEFMDFAVASTSRQLILHNEQDASFRNHNSEKVALTKELVYFYNIMRKNGLIIPKSLVQLIRDEMVGWSWYKKSMIEDLGHKYLKNLPHPYFDRLAIKLNLVYANKYAQLSKILKDNSDSIIHNIKYECNSGSRRLRIIDRDSLYTFLALYLENFYQYEICSNLYRYNPYDKNNKEEGGDSQSAISQYNFVTKGFATDCFTDVEFTHEYLSKLESFFRLFESITFDSSNFKAYRLDTNYDTGISSVKEIDISESDLSSNVNLVRNAIKDYVEHDNSKQTFLDAFDMISLFYVPHRRYYTMSNRFFFNRNIDVVKDELSNSIQIIKDNVAEFNDWFKQSVEARCKEKNEFEAQKVAKLQEVKDTLQQVSTTNVVTDTDIFKAMKQMDLSAYVNDANFGWVVEMIEKFKKNSGRPTPKQMFWIKKFYAHITGKKVSSTNGLQATQPDVYRFLQFIVKNPNVTIPNTQISSNFIDMCTRCLANDYASDGQLNWITNIKVKADRAHINY